MPAKKILYFAFTVNLKEKELLYFVLFVKADKANISFSRSCIFLQRKMVVLDIVALKKIFPLNLKEWAESMVTSVSTTKMQIPHSYTPNCNRF